MSFVSMQPYDLSVVMPCFRRPQILQAALEYLRRQTYPPERFEVLVIDDSGVHNYWRNRAVVHDFSAPFALRYLTTGLPERVYGVTVARNLGLRQARSPLILFTDDDCYAHPNWVEKHVLGHRQQERLMLTGYRTEDIEDLERALPLSIRREKCQREQARSERGEMGPGDFKTGNGSVRKEPLLRIGGFDESMARAGEYGYTDRELATRLLAEGMRMRFEPEAVVYVVPPTEQERQRREEGGTRLRARRRYRRLRRRFLLRKWFSNRFHVPGFGKSKSTRDLVDSQGGNQ